MCPRITYPPLNIWAKPCGFIRGICKEDKNSIPQCIGQSHITTAFSNMAPFPSRTRVRQTCADVKIYQTLWHPRKQVMPICTGDRTFAGQTYYDSLSWANIECLQLHRRRVHSDSALRKHELAGRMLISCRISSSRPEPGKQSLLASAICFNFYWKLRFIWGLRIKRQYFNWINWPDLTQT